jgi:hypothetical protein
MAELGTLYFKLGRHDLTSDDQHQLALFAKEPATQSAVKIHVRGFSGNSSVSYDERRTLAFSRAWSVKEALTTKHGIPLQKVRMFYISNDHMGKARVEMKRFDSVEAATKDVAQKP